jgi:hypothetical protein
VESYEGWLTEASQGRPTQGEAGKVDPQGRAADGADRG